MSDWIDLILETESNRNPDFQSKTWMDNLEESSRSCETVQELYHNELEDQTQHVIGENESAFITNYQEGINCEGAAVVAAVAAEEFFDTEVAPVYQIGRTNTNRPFKPTLEHSVTWSHVYLRNLDDGTEIGDKGPYEENHDIESSRTGVDSLAGLYAQNALLSESSKGNDTEDYEEILDKASKPTFYLNHRV